jgi:hypothetical protein
VNLEEIAMVGEHFDGTGFAAFAGCSKLRKL